MKSVSISALLGAAIGLASGPAVAQTTLDWTGLYAGLDAGYGWAGAKNQWLPGGSGLGGSNLFSPDTPGGSFHTDFNGVAAGGHIGFNQQLGVLNPMLANIVGGFEAGLMWTNLRGSSSDVFGSAVAPHVSYDTRLNWLVTATPRLGFAWNQLLIYGKAGLAAGEVKSSVFSGAGSFGLPNERFAQTQDLMGWTAGIGAEYALTPNWIVGAEYNHVDLGTKTFGGEAIPNTTWPVMYRVSPTIDMVQLRLSYKFGGLAMAPAAPGIGPQGAIDWTGAYLGGNYNHQWGDANHHFLPGGSGDDGVNLFSPDAVGGSFTRGLEGDGFGGQVGYNQSLGVFSPMLGNIVAGFEGAMMGGNASGTANNPLAPGGVPPNVSYRTQINWLAMLTPRLGYAWNNFLFYGKGGLAIGEVESRLQSTNAVIGVETFNRVQDHFGWTGGAGVEYAVTNNWIIGAEYDHVDLGSKTYGGEVNPNTTWPLQYKLSPTVDMFMLRASYKFGH